MCIVTISNSTAGLRNATSSDTLSRDLLGTAVVQYNAPLLQSSSSDAVRDHVLVQFATICSSRADVRNLTCDVDLPSARVYNWTSSYSVIATRRQPHKEGEILKIWYAVGIRLSRTPSCRRTRLTQARSAVTCSASHMRN